MSPTAHKVPGTKYFRKYHPRSESNLYGEIKVFCGSASQELGKEVCNYLSLEAGEYDRVQFSNENIFVQLQESVRGQDVYLVQTMASPVSDNIMELLIMLDTFKRDSAGRITAVIPYLSYARSDKKDQPRVPITARLIADMLQVAGADRYITVDLHSGQIQGFFNIPVDNLYATPVLLPAIQAFGKNTCIISPDAGGVERARAYAKRLGAKLAIIDKRREKANVSEIMHIIGEVEGLECVVVDDMVDTAGTLTQAARALKEAGAAGVYAAITHPVLSGPAIERIEKSDLQQLVVTDTIPLHDGARGCGKIKVMTIANLLGEAIRRITNEESVSSLFV